MARLLIVGPQGSGKGTQGVIVAARFGVPVVATGDVFRANIKGGTELGERIKAVVDAGELVSDELTGEVVRDRLAQPDAAAGFLLDGYPRNPAQVGHLDAFLEARGERLDAVIQLDVPLEESLERLVARAAEQGRSDDTEEVIRRRLEIYREQTAPILGGYAERGILVVVDGVGPVEAVTERVLSGLAEHVLVAE